MSLLLHPYRTKALELDAQDPLKDFRKRFAVPKGTASNEKIYFCNNSLGLPPVATFKMMQDQLQKWADYGVEGWFHGNDNWYTSLDTRLRYYLAEILGAEDDEVAVMNSLTVNLHLLMTSFYQPTSVRYKIMIDAPTFPSDLYAIKSHIRMHGFDPDEALIILEPQNGANFVCLEEVKKKFSQHENSIALLFFNGVNFLTGQVFDLHAITQLAHKHGCLAGFDLAHSAGNILLKLHDWNVDFAVGCSYKYLCGGPGAPGIAYVHAKHHKRDLPRLSGWWGNDPRTRFQMQLQDQFIPAGGASSWNVSTPSILGMTPLLASLEIFHEAGMDRIRKKSEMQTAFLLELLSLLPTNEFSVQTPIDPAMRGSQISLRCLKDAKGYLAALEKLDITCDFRPPDIIRVTPSPLYNTFGELYEFCCRLEKIVGEIYTERDSKVGISSAPKPRESKIANDPILT